MIHNIHEDLLHLAIEIDTIEYLDGNPNVGDHEDVIGESYEEFQQVKPIVVHKDDDGTITCVAGNHQLKGAKNRGWTHIAAITIVGDREHALRFALTDNRLPELGRIDDDLLYEQLIKVMPGHEDFFTVLGWDDFEISIMEPNEYVQPTIEANDGWEPPALVTKSEDEDEELEFTGTQEEEDKLVTQGATSAGISGKTNAVKQFSLVFLDAEQHSYWYEFLRWLKSDPVAFGSGTTTEQLINFLETTNFGDFRNEDQDG